VLTHQEILERSEFANDIGAAITLSPSGTRVLQRLGFDFQETRGVDIRYIYHCNGVTLNEASMVDFSDLDLVCGAPHQAFHLVDLHSQLAKLAVTKIPGEFTVQLHLGAKIKYIDVDNARIEL
jgi:salicylate hydroxylase